MLNNNLNLILGSNFKFITTDVCSFISGENIDTNL